MTNKIVDVYTVCWNEEIRLPYFLRLWSPIARKITIFDNGSSDNSKKIAKSFPNVIWDTEYYNTGGKIHQPSLTKVKNHGWKKSRDADLVFMGDVDEIIFYNQSSLLNLFSKTDEGFTIFKPHGYDMIPDEVPSHNGQIYDKSNFKLGVYNAKYSKACLFSPKSIEEINYNHGCHRCSPVGDCKYFSSDGFYLLHYHYLNFSFYSDRRQKVFNRLGEWAFKCQKYWRDFASKNESDQLHNEQLYNYKRLLRRREKVF
jgi:hypothetical protein